MAKRRLKKKKKRTFTHEQRREAVQRVRNNVATFDSEWAAIKSVAKTVGCSPETLRKWERMMPKKKVKVSDRETRDAIDATFDETPAEPTVPELQSTLRQTRHELSDARYRLRQAEKKIDQLTRERRSLLTIVRDFIDKELTPDSPLAQASYHSP